MMRKFLILTAVITTIFWSCKGKYPKQNEFVGIWKGPDGTIVNFDKNGTFTAKSMPAEFILLPKSDYQNIRFDGNGTWSLRKKDDGWEIFVYFREVSDQRCKCAFPLLIAGENDVLANQPPWDLFLWKGEEGEERYTFKKL